jgi:transposase
MPSDRVHSQYRRTLHDLPISGYPVHVIVRVRRFRCRTRCCRRQVFAERLTGFAEAGARKTLRLREIEKAICLALGGEAGALLAKRIGVNSSPDSLIRSMPSAPSPNQPAPRVLGVDEWAWRKGRNYGTILCDLERRRVIDLLPSASSRAFSDWLKAHPGVEVISRDRGGAFSEGASQGAPQAVQIADRWHLLSNLGECVERVLDRHRSLLKGLHESKVDSARLSSVDGTAATSVPRKVRDREERLQRRRDRYDRVLELHERGVSIRQIGRVMSLDRKTVAKYIQAGVFVEPASRKKRGSLLDPYLPYLRRRWDEGCRNGYQLLREVHAQGYEGGRSVLMDRITRWRKEAGYFSDTEEYGDRADSRRGITPRQARYLLLRHPDVLRQDQRSTLDRLRESDAEIGNLYTFVQRFRDLVRERRSDDLIGWLDEAENSGIGPLRGFARGIRRDQAAVEMAIKSEWSNGQVEGQVNRLKLIKRQMYGRAGFQLLRQRVLNRL